MCASLLRLSISLPPSLHLQLDLSVRVCSAMVPFFSSSGSSFVIWLEMIQVAFEVVVGEEG